MTFLALPAFHHLYSSELEIKEAPRGVAILQISLNQKRPPSYSSCLTGMAVLLCERECT